MHHDYEKWCYNFLLRESIGLSCLPSALWLIASPSLLRYDVRGGESLSMGFSANASFTCGLPGAIGDILSNEVSLAAIVWSSVKGYKQKH